MDSAASKIDVVVGANPAKAVDAITVEDEDQRATSEDEAAISNDLARTLTSSENARRRRDVFERWFASNAQFITESWVEKEASPGDNKADSIESTITGGQAKKIITTAREYQLELFERAKMQNTIAVSDTGSGKTLVAVLLLRYVIERELDGRQSGRQPKLSFFVVEKVVLAFQQYSVLDANLDYNIARFTGATGEMLSRETWEEAFKNNMVIVCTADVILQCLEHAFLRMDQINLLIFDEAHHTKKGHPYARIVRDHYFSEQDARNRPRIFGMTASPVDVNARHEVDREALELETLLDAKIATIANKEKLEAYVRRPREIVYTYDPVQPRCRTALAQTMVSRFSSLRKIGNLSEVAQTFYSELGRWCADHFWKLAFEERSVKKRQTRYRLKVQKNSSTTTSSIDEELKQLQEASDFADTIKIDPPQCDLSDVSSKVLKLREGLQDYFTLPSNSRCLVFVERRLTAWLLKALFEHIGPPNLRAGVVTGSSDSEDFTILENTLRQQVLTMNAFRTGEINCLFATRAAEEGLDIQDCNLVIRFDLCTTMIQYVQSRGRARMQDSVFVNLVERSNRRDEDKVREIKHIESVMEDFYEKLPASRLLFSAEAESTKVSSSKSPRVYFVESTGARLDYNNALGILERFIGRLPHEPGEALSLNYSFTTTLTGYLYEVLLPAASPIKSAIGKPRSRRLRAKQSAAFEACILLRKSAYLDDNLLSIFKTKAPAMRNARLALDLKHTDSYDVLAKPSLWYYGLGSVPNELYLSVISVRGWDQETRGLGLLTRAPLPTTPTFPIYRPDGAPAEASILPISVPLKADSLPAFTEFTRRIFWDIFHKKFEFDLERMPYWLVPLTLSARYCTTAEAVDWDYLHTVCKTECIKWEPGLSEETMIDALFVDPWSGANRYIVKSVMPNMLPADPIPEHITSGRKNAATILDYSITLFKASKDRRSWNMQQPVLRAQKISHRYNVLKAPTEAEQNSSGECYICPEPLDISLLDPKIVAMALLFPSIIHRLESYLIALEFSKEIGLKIEAGLALEAVTKDSDTTGDEDVAPINFKSGMGPNYERLEFIGDSFLKMSTSIAIFAHAEAKTEETMHIDRMTMVCNQNLFRQAEESGWYKYIRGQPFDRRKWYPPGAKLLEGRGSKTYEQDVTESKLNFNEKTIADVCEAMIGAALMSNRSAKYNETQFNDAIRAVSAFVGKTDGQRNFDHDMLEWNDFRRAYVVPQYLSEVPSPSHLRLSEKVSREDDYTFKNPLLLASAFTHGSYGTLLEKIPSYQRLEFLGDALLELAAVIDLYERFPSRGPQWLTEHKMAIVSNKFQGALCVGLGFHKHLKYVSQALPKQIQAFTEEYRAAKEQAAGTTDYWTILSDPPKCLPDVVESYVGAMFVDSNFDFAQVQRFYEKHIRPYFIDMTKYDTFAANHPVTRLHSLLSEKFGCMDFSVYAKDMPSETGLSTRVVGAVVLHSNVIAWGHAKSTKVAKVKASEKATKMIEVLTPTQYRQQCGCFCREQPKTAEDGTGDEAMGTAV